MSKPRVKLAHPPLHERNAGSRHSDCAFFVRSDSLRSDRPRSDPSSGRTNARKVSATLKAVVRRSRLVALLALIVGAASLGGPVRAAALPICPTSITQCCQITSQGPYTLGTNITETASQDCIDVVAPYVQLNLGAFQMSGTASDTGVHVLASANHFLMVGAPATITMFNVAIQNDAPNVIMFRLNLSENHTGVINNGPKTNYELINQSLGTEGFVNNAATNLAITLSEFAGNANLGIKLYNTSNALLENVQASQNAATGIKVVGGGANSLAFITADNDGLYGIWVKESSNNALASVVADNDGTGIYFGCSTSGAPDDTPCPTPGRNNRLLGTTNLSFNTKDGIAVDLGELSDQLWSITAANSGTFDAQDENPNCSNNFWVSVFATTVSPSCVSAIQP